MQEQLKLMQRLARLVELLDGAVNAASTEAVNGSQLYATNQKVDTNTANIAINTSNITNLQNQTFKTSSE